MPYLRIFLYLQVLDLLTTLIGLRSGAAEAGPFVLWLMRLGPTTGLLLSKLVALALAAICLWWKPRVIRWASYWYALLVIWNLCVIIGARQAV
jgi:hypothetical protein